MNHVVKHKTIWVEIKFPQLNSLHLGKLRFEVNENAFPHVILNFMHIKKEKVSQMLRTQALTLMAYQF